MRTFVVLAAALAACGSPAKPPAAPVADHPVVTPPPPPAAPAVPTFPGVPHNPTGDQLAWVIDRIANSGGQLTVDDVNAHFSPQFLENVSADKVVELLPAMAAQLGAIVIDNVEEPAEGMIAHAKTSAGPIDFKLALDPATGKIAGLVIEENTGPPPTSYDDAIAQLKALAPHAQLLVAEIDAKGACKPLHALAASDELAIGSAFKLYVLLGLADRIIAGKQTWDDSIPVHDEWKSLASGVTQKDDAGTKLTVRELADRMISISDNTATDHLLYTVGRKPIEAALREAKHTKPALNIPFMGTRELFILKLGDAADRAKYLALSPEKRRAFLDQTLAGKPAVDTVTDWDTARSIDKLEWFASTEDMCRVMATLRDRAQNPKAAAVLDVLSKNKGEGVPIDNVAYPYIGFKGGAEPGVLALDWLLRRADGKWFFVGLAINADEGGTIDDHKPFPIAIAVMNLLAKDAP